MRPSGPLADRQPQPPANADSAAAAQALLGDHLAARHYQRSAELTGRVCVPLAFEHAADLWNAAAAAVAETYGLLDEPRAEATVKCVRAGLAGAADEAVARAEPDVVLHGARRPPNGANAMGSTESLPVCARKPRWPTPRRRHPPPHACIGAWPRPGTTSGSAADPK